MAYQFAGSSSQYLSTPATTLEMPPITFSAWFYQSTLSTGIIASASPANSNYLGLAILVGGNVRAVDSRGFNADTIATASAGTWNHSCAVHASNNNRTAYLNGSGTNDTRLNSGVITSPAILVGTRRQSGALGVYYTGLIAEVGVWDVALTDEEVVSLAKGMTCDKVRPQSLIFYAPLVRDLIDKKGLALTNNNGATVANHPRVYA